MPRKKLYTPCTMCGTLIDSSRVNHCRERNIPITCPSCGLKRAAEERSRKALEKEERKNKELNLHCAVCGKFIPWKKSYSCEARIPKTCSRSCGAKLAMRDRTYTKESFLEKLTTYIKSVGHPQTYKEIIDGCGVKTTILHKFGISLLSLQKEIFGIDCDRAHKQDTVIEVESLESIKERLNLHSDDFSCIRILINNKVDQSIIKDYLKSLIIHIGRYVGISEIHDKSGVSIDYLMKLDITGINKEIGYKWDRRSAAENDLYELLVKVFGVDGVSREHTFMDCKGKKGWPLRFDYYLPDHNVLIELDGYSHKEGTAWYKELTEDNRAIKADYAEKHGMRLLVYSYKSLNELKRILGKIVLDVLKPVELLETPQGQSATKPVETQEGSETIERHRM